MDDNLKIEIREIVNELEAVLCDPEGKACIQGSESDLKIIDKALARLKEVSNG